MERTSVRAYVDWLMALVATEYETEPLDAGVCRTLARQVPVKKSETSGYDAARWVDRKLGLTQ